ncbi:MDR family MFS transporter [Curtobacterium herbarum]|uniref:DHA2 family efflux MFS transporter permease subunit n=1 Tax=Curtobacterium herbarum TaxID=150122 RepID=A0ABN1ZGD0_9MICO|nr:MDR family MFS transporter [Curtobacterium herbarum]MBM7474760.1 DHA2 family lincomycin resistance protein-like MFS transporter [Curtobacterium herbarum]MCS6545410.1 DHA2 family efflux MFS transporter permease subunit [Curtobacterium herbarum]
MTQAVDSAPRTGSVEESSPAGNRLVIGLLLVSAFVVILNETIMGVALPRLMDDLGISAATGQWLTTGFLLTMAVVIPITGYLLQRFNTRPVFVWAMSLFSVGTLIALLAPGFTMLLIGRIVQASGTAIMMPLLMTTVLTLIEPSHRGRVMGNISIVISVAPAIGPTISGLILNAFSWRWLFGFVLPIALAALVLGMVKVRNVSTPRKSAIDVFSVVLSAFAFGGIVYGLSSIGEAGDTGYGVPIGALVVGFVALAVFIVRQTRLQRRDAALLDLRTFSTKGFTIPIVAMAISFMAMFGTLILLPIYLERVLGLEVLQVGLLLLPGGLLMGLLSPIVGRLYDRYGPRMLLIPGSIIISAVLWALSTVTADTSVTFVLVAHIVLSLGLALTFTPLFTAALGGLPPRLYSHGSAVLGTAQQLAGAAGTALFVTLLTLGATAAATNGDVAGAATAAEATARATASGVHSAFLVGAVISMLGIIASAMVRKPATPEGAPAPAVH